MSQDYEEGSLTTANAFIAWIGRIYGPTQRRAAIIAWDAGDMFPPAPPQPAPVISDPSTDNRGADKYLERQAAFAQGFTGDACHDCGSVQMKRTGTCSTCQTCGATTGCA
jgi:hypothetical protein